MDIQNMVGKKVTIDRSGESHQGVLGIGKAVFGTRNGAERAYSLLEDNGEVLEFAASDWTVKLH
ncbi:hypothetical protein ASD45_09775 [Pseudolabrys sp. Root1462]|uniref:hypothetical protein n=1 Tax=Pseudolabrys sp. Root1462 TaxID=1736466 RepID=UPI000702B4BD|nr:hypothetical protein [Pseudolabrys sp. Root1462]KQZ01117.1 hypothetical protein ASD45_09775 [Pseudolabrys sp. Root1462]